ncbi:Na+:solute symporter [Treponema sp. OMZ 840]|uniref:sodium:solute symporter family protein n=1 Tax=Treponema sp. OMZ 840 TaxID=244313 RepID=UPI003D8A5A2A
MSWLDYAMVVAFLVGMVLIGLRTKKSVKTAEDFYVAGGKVPWWMSGISHHVTGYSGVVFVGYAGIAYATGTAIYFWWGMNIALMVTIGSMLIAPRWPRLRKFLGIQSPTEYLKMRYGTAAQVVVAVAGIFSKLIDVGAKWASIGILVQGFTGIPFYIGVLSSALVSMYYMSVGGLIADLWTDFTQWVIQTVGGIVLFIGTLVFLKTQLDLGLFQAFAALPAGHLAVFNPGRGQGSLTWTLFFAIVIFLSYNGGTWSLATRFISSKNDANARKGALLSALLYLVWPLVVFTPMWLGPLVFPGWTQAEASSKLFAELSKKFLPTGLIGLSLAAMYANTLSMCTSDCNTISAVITRDIIPIFKKDLNRDGKEGLWLARVTTFIFMAFTVVIGLLNQRFGGIAGMILAWFSALLGPTAIPLLLGLLPAFKDCDGKAAICSTLGGFLVFVFTKAGMLKLPPDFALIMPTLVAFTVFCVIGLFNKYAQKKKVPEAVENMLVNLGKND